MKSQEESLKELVREKYAEIARQDAGLNRSSCCGSGPCSTEVYNIMSEDYSELTGYADEADLGLGCGIPTQFARIQPGDTVLDLGSGAGNDCFVARALTGPEGLVLGVDFTPEMLRKARENAIKLGYDNVEFRKGDIENLPVGGNTVDVVLSNCVLNLVPDKEKAFREIFRVLKPGGHFSISDIVLIGELPTEVRKSAEMYAGCVSGAIQKSDYLSLIRQLGFQDIRLEKEKLIVIPEDILSTILDEEARQAYHNSGKGIYSITVSASKPVNATCSPGSGCC